MGTQFLLDDYENLIIKCNDFAIELSQIGDKLAENSQTNVDSLKNSFFTLQNYIRIVVDRLVTCFFQELNKSKHLQQKLCKSNKKAKKYFALQKKFSNRELTVKLKNKSLTSSLKKLKNMWKSDIVSFEDSLKKQLKSHKNLTKKYELNLKHIEKELDFMMDIPTKYEINSTNTSREFDELMKEVYQDCNIPDNSRISQDKNVSGWLSEYESESYYCEEEKIKNAIKVLINARVFEDENLKDLLKEIENTESLSQSLRSSRKNRKFFDRNSCFEVYKKDSTSFCEN